MQKDDIIYSNVSQTNKNIRLIGYKNGKRFHLEIPFRPTAFIESPEGTYRNFDGIRFAPVKCADNGDYKEFAKKYKDVSNVKVANVDILPITQFIHKSFPGELSDRQDVVRFGVVDIETRVDNGFPVPSEAQNEVNAITFYIDGIFHVFSLDSYVPKNIDVEHTVIDESKICCHYARNEKDLLAQFVIFWSKNIPDIVSGWNCSGFDFPYLYHRIKNIFGEKTVRKLSPWKSVYTKNVMGVNGQYEENVIITGVAILDYLALYKKFILEPRESYQLNSIAEVELKKGKLVSGFTTFDEFYTKDYQRFIEYNIIDVSLIIDLEKKLSLINLAKTIAYYGKCNFSDVFSPVRVWESLIYGVALDKGIVLDPRPDNGGGQMFEGGYVKAVDPNLYEWVVSFDATSLYPHIVMGWNMSPESKVSSQWDRDNLQVGCEEKFVMENCCIAENGTVFRTDKLGIIPELMEMLFSERKHAKNMAQELKKANPKDLQIARWDYKQKAIKILANSGYGVMSNAYFRFFDMDIASAITGTGRYLIQSTINHLNGHFRKTHQLNKDVVCMADTDSVYLELKDVIPTNIANDTGKVIEFLKKFSEEEIEREINNLMEKISGITGTVQNRIHFKREAIAETLVTTAKKRYGMKIWSMEDVDYKKPEFKVVGLELIRSTTPKYVRDGLNAALKFILNRNEADLQKFVKTFEDDFRNKPADVIAFPKGVNGIWKYTSCNSNEIFIKGTPGHTRACIIFNHLVKTLGLQNQYKLIHDGEKIKFVYLNEPNPHQFYVIGFRDTIPPEFELDNFIDYDKMFEKTFMQPLEALCNAVGMDAKEKNTLDGFLV